jgi:hypothetical protein
MRYIVKVALLISLNLSGMFLLSSCNNTSSTRKTSAHNERTSFTPSPIPTPELSVSALSLFDEYSKDKSAAQKKYAGKYLQVTGEVLLTNDITSQWYESPHRLNFLILKAQDTGIKSFNNSDAERDVVCSFDNRKLAPLSSSVSVGQHIAVVGIIRELPLILTDCFVRE